MKSSLYKIIILIIFLLLISYSGVSGAKDLFEEDRRSIIITDEAYTIRYEFEMKTTVKQNACNTCLLKCDNYDCRSECSNKYCK